MDHVWRKTPSGERTRLGPFTLEYQHVPQDSGHPFDPHPDGQWQARVVHRSGAVARLKTFWSPEAAKQYLGSMAQTIQQRMDTHPQPGPLSIAATIQADIEPRRMRELKELLAASR